jgi:hypothetical protein
MSETDLYQLLLDYVTSEEKRGMTGSYIETTVKSAKSWLAFNNIHIKGKIKIRDSRKTPTLENERTPSIDELRRIFSVATPREKLACVLMAHSGLRIESLGNYKGTDGLRVRDFPEMRVTSDGVTFDKVPTIVTVRSELSKARHKYFSFLSEEGCEYLSQYLTMRIRSGEKLEPETDIIDPKWHSKRFVRTINIGDSIRLALKKANFKARPYVLRSFFDTQMLIAESKGKLAHDYRIFWMGHCGTVENRYTTNRGRLPEHFIEDMRESYKRSQVFIQTIHTEDEDRKLIEFRKQILKMSGIGQDEIDQMDIENMADQDIMDQLKKKMMKVMGENGNRQKVIPLDQVEEFIGRGWEYIGSLSDDRAIMKLPFT